MLSCINTVERKAKQKQNKDTPPTGFELAVLLYCFVKAIHVSCACTHVEVGKDMCQINCSHCHLWN